MRLRTVLTVLHSGRSNPRNSSKALRNGRYEIWNAPPAQSQTTRLCKSPAQILPKGSWTTSTSNHMHVSHQDVIHYPPVYHFLRYTFAPNMIHTCSTSLRAIPFRTMKAVAIWTLYSPVYLKFPSQAYYLGLYEPVGVLTHLVSCYE